MAEGGADSDADFEQAESSEDGEEVLVICVF